jgi:hypothetical protein
MMRKITLLVIGIISVIFVDSSLFAQQKNYDNLQGKKWSGTQEISQPAPGFVKRTVEITKISDGKIEWLFTEEAGGRNPFVTNCSSSIEENSNQLPRFWCKFKSGAEMKCDVAPNGKLRTQLSKSGSTFLEQQLDPVKEEVKTNVSNGKEVKASAVEPAAKKEQGKVRVEIQNGVISFPETNAPSVNMKDLKFNFPSDSPKEIKAIQGKIYGGGIRPMQYLIPLGYDSETKIIRLLKTTANEETKSKPSKYTIGGTYNGSEGTSMKNVNDKPDVPVLLRFYIIPVEQQGYKLRIVWETGGHIVDLSPVAELPAW